MIFKDTFLMLTSYSSFEIISINVFLSFIFNLIILYKSLFIDSIIVAFSRILANSLAWKFISSKPLFFVSEITSENIPKSFKELLDLYKKTEPIDENWTAQVNTLSSKLDQLTASVQTYIQQEDMSLFNKVYQYILYRQIDMLSDYSLESILAYAKDGTDYILIASALEGQPLKQIARWSQQIEYDEDNVALLLQHYEAQLIIE